MREPFLYTGTTVAIFQSEGNFPWYSDALKIRAKMGAILIDNSFNKRGGMPSGPEASLHTHTVV